MMEFLIQLKYFASSTRFGVTMDCDVKFHSGFVASIGPAMTTKYKTTNVNDTYGVSK